MIPDGAPSTLSRLCGMIVARHGMVVGNRDPSHSPLEPGDELRCPHCHRWHHVIRRHATGTDYTASMMYWTCRGATFYAGQIGQGNRHETRRPNDSQTRHARRR
jgi:hypothetical protein